MKSRIKLESENKLSCFVKFQSETRYIYLFYCLHNLINFSGKVDAKLPTGVAFEG